MVMYYPFIYLFIYSFIAGFLVAQKNLPVNAGDIDSIPGSGRSPGEGNDNPFQYSCLGNSMAGGAWQGTVYGVIRELDTNE